MLNIPQFVPIFQMAQLLNAPCHGTESKQRISEAL